MAMAKTAAAKAKRDAEKSKVKRGSDEQSVDELPLFKKRKDDEEDCVE
jgi:hypothetical protein